MRAIVVSEFGNPADVLKTSERPVPEPQAGEVRVKIRLSPIHNHDLMIAAGKYGMLPALPFVPGTEAMGEIDALGPDVSGFEIGQRVVFGGQGLWAEYAVTKAANLIPIPDGIADETACQLISMPLSALVLLDDLNVVEGEWIVQNAANGAVGKVLNLVAGKRGINVINLVRRASAVGDLQDLGFANIVVTEEEGWQEKAKSLAQGAPIVRALDSVGGPATDAIMDLLGDGGELICFGSMSGQNMQISPKNLLFKNTIAKGFWAARRIPEIDAQKRSDMVRELITLAASGDLPLPVDQILDLYEAGRGAELTWAPGRNGKILLKP